MPLYLHVDPGSGLPIYHQIVEQVRRAVAIGVLRPGEQLPTVKQLASDLVVNPATVSRALRELEHLEIVQSVPGRGAYVRSDADAGVATSGARDVLRRSFDAAVREALSLGVEEMQLRAIVDVSISTWYHDIAEREGS